MLVESEITKRGRGERYTYVRASFIDRKGEFPRGPRDDARPSRKDRLPPGPWSIDRRQLENQAVTAFPYDRVRKEIFAVSRSTRISKAIR